MQRPISAILSAVQDKNQLPSTLWGISSVGGKSESIRSKQRPTQAREKAAPTGRSGSSRPGSSQEDELQAERNKNTDVSRMQLWERRAGLGTLYNCEILPPAALTNRIASVRLGITTLKMANESMMV